MKVIQAFRIPAGQKPVPDHSDETGAVDLREWQARGYEALHGHERRILLAPTGSGKSTLIKALAAAELAADPTRRVIIAVPQLVIARSLGPASIRADGRVLRWDPEHRLVERKGSVGRLVRFAKGKPGKAPGSRSLVCSHATLVLGHQKLKDWSNTSLYIDEAHHSHAEDEEDFRNELGSLVLHWLDEKPGPITLATATWLRANLLDIVPKSRLGDFAKFTYTMEEYLAAMQYLREVSFRFLLGKPEDALRAIYAEGDRKTIAWLPHVKTAHLKAHGDKYQALAAYQEAIGPVTARGKWTTTLRHEPDGGRPYSVCAVDFVTEEGRNDRKKALEVALDSGAPTPSLLWSLNLGKEGFDWPELERAIVIGERGSIPDVIQMMGRVLRDHPGKTTAEFNMILPYDGEADPDLLRDYIKTILVSMVVEWHVNYSLPRLRRGAASKPPNDGSGLLDDLQLVASIIGDVTDAVILDPNASNDPEATVATALANAGVDPDGEPGKATAEQVRRMFSDRTRTMCASAGELDVDISIREDVFGCVRLLAASFGHETLGQFRDALRQGWASASEMRERITGLTEAEYDAGRKEWSDGHRFPCAPMFKRLYGTTFARLRDGTEGGALEQEKLAASARIKVVADRLGLSEPWASKVLASMFASAPCAGINNEPRRVRHAYRRRAS